MLTEEQKSHLVQFGIDPKLLTEDECIDELLKLAHLLMIDKKEILKALKPNN